MPDPKLKLMNQIWQVLRCHHYACRAEQYKAGSERHYPLIVGYRISLIEISLNR